MAQLKDTFQTQAKQIYVDASALPMPTTNVQSAIQQMIPLFFDISGMLIEEGEEF